MELIHMMRHMQIPEKLRKDSEGKELTYICIPRDQYEIAYSDYNSGQSLERIIERGGFGLLELAYYFGKEKWDHIVWLGYGDKKPEHFWEWTRVKLEFPLTIEEFKKTGYKWEILQLPSYTLQCKPQAISIIKEAFQFCANHYEDNGSGALNKKYADEFVKYFDDILKEKNWW